MPPPRVYHRHPPRGVVRALWHGACKLARGAKRETRLSYAPYLADRASVIDAESLIATFGAGAGPEAAARADRSRALGNALHFCRWRQVERLILLYALGHAVGTVH